MNDDVPLLHQRTLRPSGLARWLPAGFLGVWLIGWGFGEASALTGLAQLRFEHATGWWAQLAAAGFLSFWLTGWTLGGVGAFFYMVRLTVGHDVLEWSAAGIAVRQWPFRRRRFFARDEVVDLDLLQKTGALVLRTANAGTVELTTYGPPAERRELLNELRRALDLGANHRLRVPVGWRLRGTSADGWVELEQAGQQRRAGVALLVLTAVALATAGGWRALHSGAATGDRLTGAVLGLLSYGAGLWARHVAVARRFMRVRAGALVRRTARSDDARDEHLDDERLSITRLRLESSTDSDGDIWYTLTADTPMKSTKLDSSLNDPDQPVVMGRWLAHHLQVPFDGLEAVTPQA